MSITRSIRHLLARLFSLTVRAIVPIKKGRVLCESFGGLRYACNPKYISEEILQACPNHFQLVWSFGNPQGIEEIDSRILKVRKNSLKELFYINTSEFLISNIRLNDLGWGWKKRKGQKYIMTWHGSMALKRVEFDAEDQLPPAYIRKALADSKSIDLLLSDSEWCTAFMRRAFKYDGEVLNAGLPRNDIFLQPNRIEAIKNKVRAYYNIKDDEKLLLYAPTFRVDKSIDNYIFNWENIYSAAERRWNSKFRILIRLHPNMMDTVDPSPMMTSSMCLDVTHYPDMQELLCASDVLITDYSSSMFEFAIKKTPCFLFAPDEDSYDRGFYFNLEELPFVVSRNVDELAEHIISFNEAVYNEGVHKMFSETFGLFQHQNSSKQVVDWMRDVSRRH